MLSRSMEDIRRDLDDFVVCEQDGAVIACSSLVRYSPTLAEVRSLAVADGVKRNGWGSAMVKALRQHALDTGIRTLFALTRPAPFFEQLGFARYDKEAFPEKIWRDCRLCPVQDRCDEVAVAIELGEKRSGSGH
jgi:amino-acid N-acetyltransferase